MGRACSHPSHVPAAGKNTTDEELEEMLESGNPSIFTSGVSPDMEGGHRGVSQGQASPLTFPCACRSWTRRSRSRR